MEKGLFHNGGWKKIKERRIKCNQELCNQEGNVICTSDPRTEPRKNWYRNLYFLLLFSLKSNSLSIWSIFKLLTKPIRLERLALITYLYKLIVLGHHIVLTHLTWVGPLIWTTRFRQVKLVLASRLMHFNNLIWPCLEGKKPNLTSLMDL